MLILPDPPDDEGPFRKPGRSWTAEERLNIKVWLSTPPQIWRLVRYTAACLGRGTSEEDAEDTWASFCLAELDKTIDWYDPVRAPFRPFLLMRLRQFCSDARARIARNREEPLESRTMDGDVHEFVIVDPDDDPEQRIVDRLNLRQCLAALPPGMLAVVIRRFFLGQSVRETAKDLEISEPLVKVRLFRAKQQLRGCLASVRRV